MCFPLGLLLAVCKADERWKEVVDKDFVIKSNEVTVLKLNNCSQTGSYGDFFVESCTDLSSLS